MPRTIATLLVGLLVVLGACGGSARDDAADKPTEKATVDAKPTSEGAEPTKAPDEPTEPEPIPPAAECSMRPALGSEVLVRMITPEEPPFTYRIGGGYAWDFGNEECLTSVDWVLRTEAGLPGNCTQVAYVDENPGYAEDEVPSDPFQRMLTQVGDC